MALSSEEVLGWARVIVLLLGMGWAAWMDHKDRRVSNSHWVIWVKPAIFIWCLELIARQADWSIFLTASAVVAYASVAIIGRPTISDIRAGNKMDILVTIWYIASVFGILIGLSKYGDVDFIDLLLGNETGMTALYWSTLSGLLVIFLIDLGWRMRLIHGGADAKALMWVAILVPNWSTMPVLLDHGEEVVLSLPPAIALLMWGGLSFMLIPIILIGKNILQGNVKSASDLRMFWHSTVLPIDEVEKRHVWLLTSIIDMPNGETKVYHKTRAPRRTPTDEQLSESISKLKQHHVNDVWVSYKLPLLVFLFPAIIPMALLGDVTTLILQLMGI